MSRRAVGRSLVSHAMLGVASLALAIACGDSGGGGTTEDCTAGMAGCACVSDMCFGALECVEDVCTDPEVQTTNATAPTSGVNDSSDEESYCEVAEDCGAEQVCRPDSYQCADARDFSYSLVIDEWAPDGCEGLAEAGLYVKVKVDGVVQATTGDSGCPGGWVELLAYEPAWVLELELWRTMELESDALVTKFCFRDAAEQCAQVPAGVLHDGGYEGPAGTSYLRLRFLLDVPF